MFQEKAAPAPTIKPPSPGKVPPTRVAPADIAVIVKQLDPLYMRKARMKNVDDDNRRAQQAFEKLDTEISGAEQKLSENLRDLLPTEVDLLATSEVELDRLLASIFPTDKKTQLFLKAYLNRRKALGESF